MTNLDFSGLGDLAKGTTKGKRGWTPLTLDDLGYGVGLFFDQSLTATGALILRHSPDPGAFRAPEVLRSEKWSTDWEGKDVPTSLRRGVDVYRQTKGAIEGAADVLGRYPDVVAHESPPNPAAVKGGGYSSLLAAQSVWCACAERGLGEPEMLGAQPAKALICGNANAKKVEAHAALKETVLPWIVGSHLVTNEAQRDALMVGLLWLARRKK